jgi:hypothetical protein
MADFQKSNWSRTAQADHARVYLRASPDGNGITAATVTASSMQIYTATVPFQFQGNGQVVASIPWGQTQLQNGISLEEADILPPASGSYSAGNHPRVAFKTTSTIAATIAATSVLLVQY